MKKLSTFLLLLFLSIATFSVPKIILKLDDLTALSGSSKSQPTLDFLYQKGIKASFGIIAKSIDASALPLLTTYINATLPNGDLQFEFWHHGYDHGNPEFKGTNYDYQKLHFTMADSLVNKLLGRQMHSFGAPFNAMDATTSTVIMENPNYKVYMLGAAPPVSSGIVNLNHRVNIETATGLPDSAYFVTNYLANKANYSDYMVLQAHPPYFTAASFEQFKKTIDFLIKEGCEFVLPYDYYRSLTLNAPTNLLLSTIAADQVKLSWLDNTTSEYGYKIEQSVDGINWNYLATTSENSTNFTTKPSTSSKTYYRVYASCGIKSGYSNVVQSSVLTKLNSSKSENDFLVQLFPNPCSNTVNLNFSLLSAGWVNCTIYTLTGKPEKSLISEQLSSGEHHFTFDLSGLRSGVYLCKSISAAGIIEKKMVIL